MLCKESDEYHIQCAASAILSGECFRLGLNTEVKYVSDDTRNGMSVCIQRPDKQMLKTVEVFVVLEDDDICVWEELSDYASERSCCDNTAVVLFVLPVETENGYAILYQNGASKRFSYYENLVISGVPVSIPLSLFFIVICIDDSGSWAKYVSLVCGYGIAGCNRNDMKVVASYENIYFKYDVVKSSGASIEQVVKCVSNRTGMTVEFLNDALFICLGKTIPKSTASPMESRTVRRVHLD